MPTIGRDCCTRLRMCSRSTGSRARRCARLPKRRGFVPAHRLLLRLERRALGRHRRLFVRALSRDRQGPRFHAVRQPARAIPQSPAVAVDGHAAAAAAAQDLHPGVPREQPALPQRHRPEDQAYVRSVVAPVFRRSCGSGSSSGLPPKRPACLWSGSAINVVYPYYVELMLGLPPGSPKAVERQVDLMFAILTEKLVRGRRDAEAPIEAARRATPAAPPPETVVYAWKENKEGAPRRRASSSSRSRTCI